MEAFHLKTPFTPKQFFQVFKDYNEAVFPTQILLYLLSILAVYLAVKPSPGSDKMISILLAIFWLWMGVVYHLVFFTAINKAAYIFGATFILEAVLFILYGAFRERLSFRFTRDIYSFTGILLIFFALVIYPLLGYFMGHIYPSSPTFGLPCPTTIFTAGFLLFSTKKCPVPILVIPFLWSIIGFSAAFNFGMWEDTGLLVSELLSLFLILLKNRKLSQSPHR